MIILSVGVNALTVGIIIRHICSDSNVSPTEVTSPDADVEDTSVFGRPDRIILTGYDKSVTLTPTDESYGKILSLNELRCIYTQSFERALTAIEEKSNVYLIEYVYDTPHLIDRTKEPVEAVSILFSLTGKSHGLMRIASSEQFATYGKLAVEPELILLVTELLG